MKTNPAYHNLIEGTTHPVQWQSDLSAGIKNVAELVAMLKLDTEAFPEVDFDTPFPVRVPRGYVGRMQPGSPDDPLLLQVIPLAKERHKTTGFDLDPVGDLKAIRRPGILHKYAGRALVITTGACAIHCRYCFRRHFPYQSETTHLNEWERLITMIGEDLSLSEVILSGGDPLMLTDARLNEITSRLINIPHIRRIRIHSRLPIVLPSRIDDRLLTWLAPIAKQTVMVIHGNHPNELDKSVEGALSRLKSIGVTLLNQSVLLKGVNDDCDTLASLSERLYDLGVMPYYLHLLDRVQGAAHFEVSEARAKLIYRDLHATLSGFLLPKLVREIAGQPGKTLITPG